MARFTGGVRVNTTEKPTLARRAAAITAVVP